MTIKKTKSEKELNWFEMFAAKAIKVTGSSSAFITACVLIIVWILTGPLFHYSDVWQLAINTGTTIITFLMVFLIQKKGLIITTPNWLNSLKKEKSHKTTHSIEDTMFLKDEKKKVNKKNRCPYSESKKCITFQPIFTKSINIKSD